MELRKTLTKDEKRYVFSIYGNPFKKYQTDPILFGEKVLNHFYYSDIKNLINSVLKYQVTIAKSCNGVGKTFVAADIATWFYKCFKPAEVYTVAYPEPKLKQLLWGRINDNIIQHPKLFENDRINVLNISNKSSFITGVTIGQAGNEAQQEARFSGRHCPHLLFIVDEGDTIPWPIYRGIESNGSGGFVRTLILFNPREKIGPLWTMEEKGTANVVNLEAFNHPNVITGENLIPGAVDRNITVRRISQWCRPAMKDEPPTEESFILPSFLEGAQAVDQKGELLPPLVAGKYIVEEPCFNYMVLGRYPSSSSHQLIRDEWVDKAFERYRFYVMKNGDKPPANVTITMGFDVADEGDDENVVSIRYGNMIKYLIYWNGVDTIISGKKGIELYYTYNVKEAFIDGTGVGAGIAPHMRSKGCRANKIMVGSAPTIKSDMGEFNLLRDQLWWAVREWLRTCETAMVVPNEKFRVEAITPRYTTDVRTGKIKVWDRDQIKKEIGRSPDTLSSVILLFAPKRPLPGLAIRNV